MAALVQTIPQQSGTVTLLQTRPASATTGHSPFISASQIAQPHGHTMSFSSYNGVNNSASNRNSVAPYAFTTTPGLVNGVGNSHQQRQMSWSQSRSDSLHSSIPPSQNSNPHYPSNFAAGSVSSSSASSTSSLRPSYISQDDSILSSRRRTPDLAPRPLSTINLSTDPSLPDFSSVNPSSASNSPLPATSTTTTSKPLPDRYRRGKRTTEDNATTVAPAASIPIRTSSYDLAPSTIALPPASRPSVVVHGRTPSADDSRLPKQPNPEIAKRYRRRSWANVDALSQEVSSSLFAPLPDLKFTLPETSRPTSSHSAKKSDTENGHVENRSPPSAASLDSKFSTAASPSPSSLSHQMTDNPTPSPSSLASQASAQPTHSPAAQRLADISKATGGKKPGKSRLRRAFSFGSAAELRKVSAQNSMSRRDGEQLEQTATNEELDPEQAAIAAQQEANGLGNSIYSHQLGSTDNLSISSTASSASIMLRKMGRGMKKSTRSLVGLFRPKSIASVNSEPIIVEPSAPQVSVVNIEAERKIVTANINPHEQTGGGTVFPKIQPTTKDKTKASAVSIENNLQDISNSRKSIVGGDRERAEVLAAVKKGILKRSGTSSPVGRATDLTPPHLPDSPNSSTPSTPEENPHRTGHRRTDTVKIEGEDYFLSQGKSGSEANSAPVSSHSVVAKSIVFSPRIQFYETWPSGEYDRRGEAATCNKLTPLLAQQIKEELNTLKMEMEVHETSKIYTHFL